MNGKHLSVLLIIFFIFIAVTSFAVDFQFGIKGGINLSSFDGEDSAFSERKVGFTAGVFGTIFFTDTFAIQPEVLFSLKGEKREYGVEAVHNNLYYIELPLLLKYYIPEYRFKIGPSLYAGPYLGINLWNRAVAKDEFKAYLEAIGEDTKAGYEDVNSLDFGLSGGFGIDFYRTLFDFRLSYGLISTDSSDSNLDLKNRVLMISLGILLKIK
jgi:hypothetical protein